MPARLRAAGERIGAARVVALASDQSNAASVRSLARGESTTAQASRPLLSVTDASAPAASTSTATSSTGRASAWHWLAASSRPAPKLSSKALSAVLASWQPVPIVQ